MGVRDNNLYIGGIRAKSLVEEFGSPLYVYDEEIMRTRIISLLVVASILILGCAPQEEMPRLIPM